MAIIIFAIFLTALVVVSIINAKEPEEEPDTLTIEQMRDLNTMQILKEYKMQIDSYLNQGILDQNEHRAEERWISDELDKIESKYQSKTENAPESPEMAQMRKGADDFFQYTDDMFRRNK